MKARVPKPEPSAAAKEKAEKANYKSNRAYMNYVHRVFMIELRKLEKYGGVRLLRASRGAYDIGEAKIEENTILPLLTSVEDLMAGAEPEYGEPDFKEVLAHTFWNMRGELLEIGFDPQEALWEWREPFTMEDFPFDWYTSVSEREKKEEYLSFVNQMSRICLTLMCMCALELHRNEKFGAERMAKVMRPVAERWRRLMLLYLTMDEDAVIREQKAVRDEFNAMGMFSEEYGI